MITGLILAGGRGSRMDNVDKGLQLLNSRPLVEHVLERLQPQVEAMIINANRNLEQYRRYGKPVWPDALPDFAGPLAGLQTGLIHCATPLLITVPCDSPFLPLDLVTRLHGALIEADADIAVAASGDDEHQHNHPVFCLLKATLLPSLNHYLQAGGRKMSAWQASCKMITLHFGDESAFRNINDRAELAQCELARQ
jgi:molybdenum cofactor guanylyltransferase